MKIEKAVTKLTEDIEKISGGLEKPFKDILSFIKKHKKALILSAIIYLVYRYLFSEEN